MGNNTLYQVNTTSIPKFYGNAAKYNNNEVCNEINLTNIYNGVVRADVHIREDYIISCGWNYFTINY
ncbi:MAG TPA: hypothetical protein VJ729_01920 [Nitrososphaeraceae archaeon]|nr:hypothetical protein [Nitrososphaeraceae archaeon]